jgi:hypothetical protein
LEAIEKTGIIKRAKCYTKISYTVLILWWFFGGLDFVLLHVLFYVAAVEVQPNKFDMTTFPEL